MQKAKQIDPFLPRLQEIRDQLTSIGATPDHEFMVRTALNAVFEEWETFVQDILGKSYSSRMGRDVGSSSPRRDQIVDQGEE